MSQTQVAIDRSQIPYAMPAASNVCIAEPAAIPRTREEIRARIEEIGIIPAPRVLSAEDATFAANTVARAGIPIVEINTAVPGALGIISHLAKHAPDVVVGAGSVSNAKMARRCLDEGAKFLASDGLLPDVMELAAKAEVVAIPGGLTPTEVIAAWNAGADLVRVCPCSAVGGHNYIRFMKSALPEARLVAAGGVDQLNAFDFAVAGASALSVGRELFPDKAIWLRQDRRIQELARRFLSAVDKAPSKQRSQI